MITPHVAGSLDTEIRRLVDAALDELERYARGEAALHPVRRADLQYTA
ncbi:hypothetical protein O7626_19265 [Micromonospora sp. WMMD1102]|nr:hypothetical protein [Micromonospora sp. WMMD1102]MDG4788054.1 hypothetical protein [Micromonospora sp. WMMD1102]